MQNGFQQKTSVSLGNLYAYAQEISDDHMRDKIVQNLYKKSQQLCESSVIHKNKKNDKRTEKLDAIFTSPIFGFPIMIIMLGIVFYLTIAGANIPSSMLATFFGWLENHLTAFFMYMNSPDWLHGILVLGLYRGTTWVISVMLPPMAIFFPTFALLENYGYLPRVAFNMDRIFKSVGAHGKQSLTMAMGFGCNAAAMLSSRIIESPRERMLAILTNNFVPCNGRWGTLIVLASLFMAAGYTGGLKSLVTTSVIVGIVMVGVIVTFIVSWVLSKTALKGVPTHYTLELPPYRRPKFFDTVIRSSLTKSLSVLSRAIKVAAPAAILTWVIANIYVGDTSILMYIVNFLDPFGKMLGLDGFILMAFLIGLPANEIVLPILLMGYLSTGSLTEVDNLVDLKQIFVEHGWTWLTALNMMLFSLLHFPCGTTLVNIYKETKSKKWTFLAFLIPTVIAITVTFTIAQTVYFLR
ncbi:MAG: ferrous iron transporter B [Bacillota bacterium]|jgi:ferrous iron transport protein B|uniref:ferrous iron transporter B n=1 Tax=Fictibacillus TaxID=1329200 RepID=UPI0018CF0684|nr:MULTISPECIES: ferrous iron transporter B [unclassified Fictibacillus]MBH0157159.1 ferrous iron transporter B [Fictibacillus sp. 5RED26]MBH0159480.1 ferrous iron transporter B [Fictibacillus sp. 26RED30]MBH0163721.1 ferrous iron transporter B [Fictibacillus sp. 7GRE50]MBH0169653.1 ferrous iron transporter B [Fictibacillus sp. 18YEL24]MBH0174153.1 ferrous iron transporter B [Fictibacillus sp. 23RED33]